MAHHTSRLYASAGPMKARYAASSRLICSVAAFKAAIYAAVWRGEEECSRFWMLMALKQEYYH